MTPPALTSEFPPCRSLLDIIGVAQRPGETILEAAERGMVQAIRAAIAEEREACAVIAESPDTPYRRVYDPYDRPDAIREGIAAAIRARASDCGQATPQE